MTKKPKNDKIEYQKCGNCRAYPKGADKTCNGEFRAESGWCNKWADKTPKHYERYAGAVMGNKIDQIVDCKGDWQETTIRKGTHRICRDMFITKYHDILGLCIVKNGSISSRAALTAEEMNSIIVHYGLEPTYSSIFRHAATYRTPQSNNLVKWLLDSAGAGV